MIHFGKRPTSRPIDKPAGLRGPDWVQANPKHIQRALDHALGLPGGGWFVVDASRNLGTSPRSYTLLGQEMVVWRCHGRVIAAPDACPHMGARLSDGHVSDGQLVCPWHGLELGAEGRGAWKPTGAYDDGVLLWVQMGDEARTEAPALPPRPARYIDGVVRVEANCLPADVIANRLDPWHGAHFHPYSFSALEVLEASPELLLLRVSKKLAGPVCIEVDATFHCPDPRTIVMTIVDGEGTGSVVETHATPIAPGRTAIIEATLAASERPGFQMATALAPLIRPFVRIAARRLWVDDAAYAERLHQLREQGQPVFNISNTSRSPDGPAFRTQEASPE